MRLQKGRISAALIGLMVLGMLSGCGKKQEEAYSSPSFKDSSKEVASSGDSEEENASITDALNIASFTDATVSDAKSVKDVLASAGDAQIMGVYNDKVYYNMLAEFKITVDGTTWKLFNDAEVASATGATKDYVDNLWKGYKSPYDEETSYAAVAYNVETGSNIIVSYINPDKYLMPEFGAFDYLKMASERYEECKVSKVTFLGQAYTCLDVPDSQASVGRRTQFAIDKEGLIVLITFTLSEEVELEDAVKLLTPLYY